MFVSLHSCKSRKEFSGSYQKPKTKNHDKLEVSIPNTFG